jgi:type VI secretion system protein ImpA
MSGQYDLQTLWADLSEQAPCGLDLEYDAEFMALERVATQRSERAIGDSVIAAEPPDWERVGEQAMALAQRTRDLRVAMHLTRAWTRQRGLSGWADGLTLLRGLLDQQWAAVHPQLDADDDDDPTARVNALIGLSDPQDALALLRGTWFVQSPRLGRFSLRDLRVAEGTLQPSQGSDTPPPSLLEIEACCRDCEAQALADTAQVLRRALDDARALDQLLSERLGTLAPDLKALLTDLSELDRFVQSQYQAREGNAMPAAEDAQAPVAAGQPVAVPGQINGPEDVRRRLDEICDFYARNEPSSPVPLLLRRARRLVGCDFLALLKDLTPNGLDELERVVGRSEAE